jgi:hypothetical protein
MELGSHLFQLIKNQFPLLSQIGFLLLEFLSLSLLILEINLFFDLFFYLPTTQKDHISTSLICKLFSDYEISICFQIVTSLSVHVLD